MVNPKDEKFIRQVEGLIDPAEVSKLYFFAQFKALLPNALFKRILAQTSRKTPYMGFVIEPYSFFLFYKLKDIEKAKAMLPQRYELMKCSVFADEEPQYLMGMGIFNTKASTFWGTRLETYLVAKDTQTGLVSWIFIDIISNTLIARPKEGVANRNSSRVLFTTDSRGDIILDIQDEKHGRKIVLNANITNGIRRKLDQPLWVLGNTSIAHSVELSSKNEDPFAVIFDPKEVESGLDIPLNDIEMKENNLFPDLAETKPCKALCFPYAQHYIADSPGCRTVVRNMDDMTKHYDRLAELKGLKTFSTKAINLQFIIGLIVSNLAALGFIILLTMKFKGVQ